MARGTNIIIPLAALLLVALAPPGTGLSCDWEQPAAAAHAESPAWFVTLLDFLHAGKLDPGRVEETPQESPNRARLPEHPGGLLPNNAD